LPLCRVFIVSFFRNSAFFYKKEDITFGSRNQNRDHELHTTPAL
jgi:hypothetical protein